MKAASFGFKNAWIAVKGASAAAVAEALSLRGVREADWATGVQAAYEDSATGAVFVTPPIDSWVLCVGWPLVASVDARPPEFGLRATEWATTLQTEVQYFATHRVVEAHAWARARPSGLERAYLYVGESGETVLDEGPPTEEEKALGFAFFDPSSDEAQADDYWDREDLTYPDESHVVALAARWSVDPTAFDGRDLEVGPGMIGDFGEPAASAQPTPTARKPWWKPW